MQAKKTEPASAPEDATQHTQVISRLTGNSHFTALIEQFKARLPERLEAMRAAEADGDLEGLAGHARWLKNAGGSVGFDAFTDPARALLRAAETGDAPAVSAALRQLADRMGRV